MVRYPPVSSCRTQRRIDRRKKTARDAMASAEPEKNGTDGGTVGGDGNSAAPRGGDAVAAGLTFHGVLLSADKRKSCSPPGSAARRTQGMGPAHARSLAASRDRP